MFTFIDDKRGNILQAALTTFLTYGFKKTSMDDIAKQANVSRPALYQLFKNKTDIFRALSKELLGNAAGQAKYAFEQDQNLRNQLFEAIDSSILEMHRFADQSPHGIELMGINQEIARDIELEWKEEMILILARGIDQAFEKQTATANKIKKHNLDSAAIARILMQCMEGMRETYLSGEKIDHYVEQLIDFIALSLEN